MWVFAQGGNAVDAAIAANAAIAVTGPHLCGMGGDLFALVNTPDGEVHALNASGRAGSGADADALRADGLAEMPFRGDIRSVTIPGCIDGWTTLHERYGSVGLDVVLAPAIRLAASGFPASPLLTRSITLVEDPEAREHLTELAVQATRPGALVRRPGSALALQAIVRGGRNAFYRGAFGEGLVALGAGWFTEADLAASQATWVEPLRHEVFGVVLSTIPPNSQGYLTLGTAGLADSIGLPDDPDDDRWAHVLIEAAIAASHDRPMLLHDRAGAEVLTTVLERAALVDPERASRRPVPAHDGDTTYLATADGSGLAVSLIQSNASGFGSWLVEPTTGINLQNRGLGFSLERGHPAEIGPGRRPPHTLCPAMAHRDGRLAAVLGTMGGDAQPQIVAQIAARLFRGGQSPAEAIAAPRWVLKGPATGFDTWTAPVPPTVVIEQDAPSAWHEGLSARGHEVTTVEPFSSGAGHAHAIVTEPGGTLAAAADPRSWIGSAAAL